MPECERKTHAGKISRMNEISSSTEKSRLRKLVRENRSARVYDPEHAVGIQINLAELCQLHGAQKVCCYLPYGDEPDTELFIDWALESGIQILLPVAREDGSLDWVNYEGERSQGIFGFEEGSGEPATTEDIDLVIAPALAVGRNGFRLGQGKGFYDRFLESVAVPCVAVVFDEEILDSVPCEDHDQPVDSVVTPTRTLLLADLN